MNPKPLRVAVVGAGFAGLASAALLARQGHAVTVFERFDEPRSVGAGVLLQPTGLAALQALGVLGEVLQRGARVTRLWGVNHRQRPVVDLDYADWRAGGHGLGLHRGVLFEALWQAAARAGATVRTGQAIERLAALEADHDLTVIANGAASTLRAQTGLPVRERLYPWGAVWAILDDPTGSAGETLWQWYRGAHQMLGVMPTGRAPGRDVPVVSLFWSLHADRHEAWRARGLAAWKDEVRALHTGADALLEQIERPEHLTWVRYRDVVMPRYHTARSVVIGDAAHATSPQLGQGTNLALLDALALARCVARPVPLARALADYTALRRAHLHFYGQASRLLTPLFQSDLRGLPWLRDLCMASVGRWPGIGATQRAVLVGVRRNWWGWRPLRPEAIGADSP